MNYYSHHIGDYTKDTAHLSLLEDGAYRRLMDRYYTTETALPDDEAALFRVVRARSDDEQAAVRIVLAEFFTLTGAGWIHKRCEAEIDAFKAKSIKAADAANKRWNKPGNANPMPTHCERIPNALPTNNQEPITNNQEPNDDDSTAASDPASSSVPSNFDEGGFALPAQAPLPMREQPPISDDPAVVLSVALRRQGVNCMSTNPHLIAWVADGVSLALLTEAVALAREQKGDAPIPPGYLAPIVAKLRNPPAARATTQRAPALNEKFNFSHLDHSSSARAMAESVARHGITVPDDGEEIEI